MNNIQSQVTLLIERAADAADSTDALRWSQAACNAANALCALATARKEESTKIF